MKKERMILDGTEEAQLQELASVPQVKISFEISLDSDEILR
jgi:hypothetical protein